MRISAAFIVSAFLLASEASASLVSTQHARLARRMNRQKRCVERGSTNNSNNNDFNVNNVSSSSAASPPAETTNAPSPDPAPPSGHQQGTIDAWGPCGSPNATPDPTQWGGANGSIDWLNCGIDGAGWQPPPITAQNVIAKDLREVLSWPNNPFSGCADFIGFFEQAAAETGVPAIFFASIAMQESSCRPYVTGGNGEIGLMQITPDKCSGDCYEPGNNIRIASQYFKRVLDNNGGNLAKTMGEYNGWFEGLTFNTATNKGCGCTCQNNLDYLLHIFDGYIQGVAPSSINMGKYFNLAWC